MDIVEEDGKGISQQRRIRIWDKKKRNYVQVNANEVDRARGNKRIKTESGAYAKKDKEAVGEIYKKWQQKTHRSVAATGSQEDPLVNGGKERGAGRFKYRHTKGRSEEGGGGGGRGGRGGGGEPFVGSELKSRDQIMKERKEAKKKGGRGGRGGGRGDGGGRGGGRGGGGRGGGRGGGGRSGGPRRAVDAGAVDAGAVDAGAVDAGAAAAEAGAESFIFMSHKIRVFRSVNPRAGRCRCPRWTLR